MRLVEPRVLPRPYVARLLVVALAAALGSAGTVGCKATRSPSEVPPAPTVEGIAPDWTSMPLSWEKLETIEQWLDSNETADSPSLRTEALLELNEGRLAFSEADLRRRTAPTAALEARLESARAGFEQILADAEATTGQRARARIGLAGVRALLAAPSGPKLPIVSREQWDARPPRTSDLEALRGSWSRVTLHHSVDTLSEESDGSLASSIHALHAIQRYHMEQNGWGDIGYHYLVDSAGRVFEGRQLQWQGAHASGDNNVQNLGICMLGDFTDRPPSREALEALRVLLDQVRERYRIPTARIYPHRKFKNSICPGDYLTAWLERYK